VVVVRRVVRYCLCALALLALSGSTANAALLSGILPGLLSTPDRPASCDDTTSQPFADWGDTSDYVLVPGGDFESGAAGWTLSGGAAVTPGNEPFRVGGTGDRRSLSLPAGSAVTTPPMCFAPGDLKLRFFAVSTGSSASYLQVRVVVKSALGILSILDGGTMSTNSVWVPSPQLKLYLTNVTSLISTDAISFRFVPAGSASWRIDDVYLDPFKDG
jgi:hypothetical protein